ncbi:hypothetical protein [Coprothermobacter platensis]|uniref:hypothetical protein n=1 Tax=Coprothermobacter platensis TaxID=108819 RepID=UPI00036EE15F|nr:hypothetical protein [Coprothermobacter platensis]
MDITFKKETLSMCKDLSLQRGVEHSSYDNDYSTFANVEPLPEDFGGLNVVSYTPLSPSLIERCEIDQLESRIAIVDGVQMTMLRKIQRNGMWAYLVGLAAGAVEIWPSRDLIPSTIKRELVLFVPKENLTLPFDDSYGNIRFRTVPYEPENERRQLNSVVSDTRSQLEIDALNQAVADFNGEGLLLRDGRLTYGDPMTRFNGPVGLVKTLEPRSNVSVFSNYVQRLNFGEVSCLIETENKNEEDGSGIRRYFAYLRIMDVGDPESLEGIVRLDFTGKADIGSSLADVALRAAKVVFSLSVEGPYPRSPYNLLTINWLENRLRSLLPDPMVVSLDIAREVNRFGS